MSYAAAVALKLIGLALGGEAGARLARVLVATALAAPCVSGAQTPRFVLELEGGAVWQSYNDAEIPNDGTATRFSLADLTGHGPLPGGRVYVTWNFGERHGLHALAAPLSLTGTGLPDAPIAFEGARFAGGPGRAIDAALEVGYDLGDDLTLQAGYRTLEGGADVEETYNFAWLHYAVASIVWRP
jgi:hypothetical protein